MFNGKLGQFNQELISTRDPASYRLLNKRQERISARLLNDEIKANLCLAVTSQQKKNSFETPPCKILKGRWAAVSLFHGIFIGISGKLGEDSMGKESSPLESIRELG